MTDEVLVLETTDEVVVEVTEAPEEVILLETTDVEVIVTGSTGPTGIPGPPGTPGLPGDVATATSIYEQNPASAVWTVNHGLGYFPSVTVVTSAGDVVHGDVHYVDANTVVLTFSAAFGGSAYFS